MRALDAIVRVPPSKSLTNRALAAAAFATGTSGIVNPLVADDTTLMAGALRALGVRILEEPGRWIVEGACGPPRIAEATLALGNAGTAMRFLTPLVAAGRGRYVLDGTARMRERPIGDLLSALRSLGVEARSLGANGCPPVEVVASGLPGGDVTLRGSVSSQFVSGLLLAAPLAAGDLVIRIDGPLVSRPYVHLTLDVMKRFGAAIEEIAGPAWRIAPTGYAAREYEIEGDASSACFWFAAAAVTAGRVLVAGIPAGSRQGDLGFLDLLEGMGCRVRRDDPRGLVVEGSALRGIDADLRDMPDTAPPLAAVAIFASGPTRIRGAAHLRDKESDRIAGLAAGLGRLGARVEEHRDGLTIHPGPLHGAALDPLEDHRLAMAFAVAGLGIPGVEVLHPECVAKSYPLFLAELQAAAAPHPGTAPRGISS
ncbi:MAG: 3-phosphoshikimate 1-carboxyvinyltransferase [Acidobacteria bacterium]|nr:3-phosphoshikimate 1-carboxyvinyltransferase [Acidobacteriota bacterium]